MTQKKADKKMQDLPPKKDAKGGAARRPASANAGGGASLSGGGARAAGGGARAAGGGARAAGGGARAAGGRSLS